MWTTVFALILLCSASYSSNPLLDKSKIKALEDDVKIATYKTKKVNYDIDVLAARTSILALELEYTAFDLVINIETLLGELLFPTDAERVVAEINSTAVTVVTNVKRLEEANSRLDASVSKIEADLQDDLQSLKTDQLLLESYISNFNLTYDIGKDNIVLATNFIVLTLQTELEGLTDPEVDIIFNLAQQIQDVLLTEQGYLDNARQSFDGNAYQMTEALKKVIDQAAVDTSTLKTTTITKIPTTSPPSTTMSLIPTTSPTTTTITVVPPTTTTPSTQH